MEIIGKTFGYKGIGGMVYVVIVQSFVKAGEQYDSDSYAGKQVIITESGESLTQDWACIAKLVEGRVKSGDYKLLR